MNENKPQVIQIDSSCAKDGTGENYIIKVVRPDNSEFLVLIPNPAAEYRSINKNKDIAESNGVPFGLNFVCEGHYQ